MNKHVDKDGIDWVAKWKAEAETPTSEYFNFSFSMAEQIEALARWQHEMSRRFKEQQTWRWGGVS